MRARTTTRALVALVTALGLGSGAVADHAYFHVDSSGTTTYTTSAYDGASTSTDVDVSCQDVHMESGAVLTAHCNKKSAGGTIEHYETSVELDLHAGCSGGVLEWDQTNISGEATDIAADLSSDGNSYEVTAKCDGAEGTLSVDGRFGNNGGSFAQS